MLQLNLEIKRPVECRVVLTSDTVKDGRLGTLLSDSSVPKVTADLCGTENDVLNYLRTLGCRVSGVFDLQSAYQALNYLKFGQSIMTNTSNLSTVDLLKNMGLITDSKEQQCSEQFRLRQVLTAYLHFQETLPPFILNLLEAKCRTDLDIASNFHLQEAKGCREQLMELFEGRCIHVRPQKSRYQGGLEDRLRHELKDFAQIKVLPHGKCAIVQMSDTSDVPPAVNALRGPDFQVWPLTQICTCYFLPKLAFL